MVRRAIVAGAHRRREIRIADLHAHDAGLMGAIACTTTDTYKYAYPTGTTGKIGRARATCGNTRISLVVEDDGIVWPITGQPRGIAISSRVAGRLADNLHTKMVFARAQGHAHRSEIFD